MVRKGQVKTGQVRTGQVRTGQVRTGQVRTGQFSTGQVRTSQVRTGQVETLSQILTFSNCYMADNLFNFHSKKDLLLATKPFPWEVLLVRNAESTDRFADPSFFVSFSLFSALVNITMVSSIGSAAILF